MDNVALKRASWIDETMNVIMEIAKRHGHHRETNDKTSEMVWNRQSLHRVLDDSTTFQIAFYAVYKGQAFFFLKVWSTCIIASNDHFLHHFLFSSAVICSDTSRRSIILRRFEREKMMRRCE